MRGRRLRSALVLAAFLIPGVYGCSGDRRYDQTVCALIDVSGTYSDQRAEVARILKRDVLPGLVPGDSFLLLRIDSQSYEKENVELFVTLDPRPSQSNAQKLELARALDAFATREIHAKHTDIAGAMMLGAEYLRELGSGSRVMLVFSDLREDLPPGTVRALEPGEFSEIEVVTVNVKRLRADGHDPKVFRARLNRWEDRARDAGAAGWKNFVDSGQLPAYLEGARTDSNDSDSA